MAQGAALSARRPALSWPGAPRLSAARRRQGARLLPPRSAPTIDLGSDRRSCPSGRAAGRTRVPPTRPRVEVAAPHRAGDRAHHRARPWPRWSCSTATASVVRGYGPGRRSFRPAGGARGPGRPPRHRPAAATATTTRRYAFEWLSRASSIRLHHARPIIVDGRVRGRAAAVALAAGPVPRPLRGPGQDRLGGPGHLRRADPAGGPRVARRDAGPSRRSEPGLRATSPPAAATVPETPTTAAVEIRSSTRTSAPWPRPSRGASGYLRDFAAAVSHEFKTPLAGIGGAVELLQDHGETMSEGRARRFLDNIAADTARLTPAGHPPARPRPRRHGPPRGRRRRRPGRARPPRGRRPRRRGLRGRRRPARRPAAVAVPERDRRGGADHPDRKQPPGRGDDR